MTWLAFLNDNANLLLVIVTGIYATLTYFYVREARLQRLQQIAPYPRLVFQKAPDKVLVENIGPGIAAEVMLQGFAWKDQGVTWHCSFEPVYTIQPREIVPLKFSIESPDFEGRPLLDHRAIFQIAFQGALRVLDDVPLILNLYSKDVLGIYYRSQVRVDAQDWYMSWKHGQKQRWTAVTLPAMRRREKWPETLPHAGQNEEERESNSKVENRE